MRKSIIIGIIVIIALGTGFIINKRINDEKITGVKFEGKLEQKNQFQLSPTLPQGPFYSVEIKSSPTYNLNSYYFTYKAIIKNTLVTPFITSFGFRECNFSDENENKYSGYLSGDENSFEKAIFPNESREFISNDVYMYLRDFKKINGGFQKCSYNEKGENVCKLIKVLKVINCTGQISTDGRDAGAGYEPQFNIEITFPTL